MSVQPCLVFMCFPTRVTMKFSTISTTAFSHFGMSFLGKHQADCRVNVPEIINVLITTFVIFFYGTSCAAVTVSATLSPEIIVPLFIEIY